MARGGGTVGASTLAIEATPTVRVGIAATATTAVVTVSAAKVASAVKAAAEWKVANAATGVVTEVARGNVHPSVVIARARAVVIAKICVVRIARARVAGNAKDHVVMDGRTRLRDMSRMLEQTSARAQS